MTRATIDMRLRAGRIGALHRSVYLLGPVAPPRAREMAAVLACGANAYVSHADAAHLHHLLPPPAPTDPVHITVTERNPGARPGIIVHRTGSLQPVDIATVDGISLTSPARTILDVAPGLSTAELERVVAESYARNLCSRHRFESLLARHPRRPGSAALRELIDGGAPAFTRSEAERRFLTLVRRAELPPPQVNTRLHGYEVDFLWHANRLVVEVDGHAFHASRPQRARDMERDQDLVGHGYRVIRVSWQQIDAHPEALAARLAGLLA